MHTTLSLFISCVSNEFASYRNVLRALLDGKKLQVHIQEQFKETPSGDPILLKLDDYIRHCYAVIHLVGDQSGATASAPNREELLRKYPRLPEKLGLSPEMVEQLTYTQWEAWLALYHRTKLIIAVPTAEAPREGAPAAAEAAAQKDAQARHLRNLKELHSRHPEIEFANCDRLVIGLQNFLIDLSPEALAAYLRTRDRRAERFGPSMVDTLKARLRRLNEWPGRPRRTMAGEEAVAGAEAVSVEEAVARRLHFGIAAYIQITGLFPDFLQPERDDLVAIVEELAVRESALDLLAFVQRILWSIGEAQPEKAAGLKTWLDQALAACGSNGEALAGSMGHAEKSWLESCPEPPLPRLELGWQRALSDETAVERTAYIRWGRCRAPVDFGERKRGACETAVTETVDAVLDDAVRGDWPYERVEVFVDKERLNYRWEYREEADLHLWPVVLRLNRKPYERKKLSAPPPVVCRERIARWSDKDAAFKPRVEVAGAFLASCPGGETPPAMLLKAAEAAGIGLWTRREIDESFATELLETIDRAPLQELPERVHERRKIAPDGPWGQVALLYDDKALPAIEYNSERFDAARRCRTSAGLG